MFRLIHKRMKGEKGFTLIELLVVIIIIAILAAIAIPTFLGQRQRAYDASAKSLVRNAMTAIETTYVDTRTFATVNAAALALIEPSITWSTTTAAVDTYVDEKTVGFGGLGEDTYTVGHTSKSGKLFAVSVNKKTGVIAYTPSAW